MDKKKYKTETRVKSSLPWGFYVFKYIQGRTLNPKGGHLFCVLCVVLQTSSGEKSGTGGKKKQEKNKKRNNRQQQKRQREKNNVKKHRANQQKKRKNKKVAKKVTQLGPQTIKNR